MPRSSTTPLTTPLGSLTQPEGRTTSSCVECGSTRTTELAMTLTDGTPVHFVSCRACEHKSWRDVGGELLVDQVLDKTRKVR